VTGPGDGACKVGEGEVKGRGEGDSPGGWRPRGRSGGRQGFREVQSGDLTSRPHAVLASVRGHQTTSILFELMLIVHRQG
jgi:hypothetical protein